jgi:hypothetical protein
MITKFNQGAGVPLFVSAGAFALAMIATVRAMLTYVQSRTVEAQRSNPALKVLFCACQCCLCCFNRCIK